MQLKTVIVADDVESIRNYVKELLTEFGIHVILCANGKDLFELINQPNLFLDLIILDLSMPEVNGLLALQQMAAIKKAKGFKVCILSGHKDPKLVAKAIELNADDFLTKPFDEDLLVNRVKNLLGLNNVEFTKFAYARVNFIATILHFPMLFNFNITGLSEEGVLIESIVNFKEQSVISFLCRALSDIIGLDQEFAVKILKIKVEKEKFLISAVFVNMPENVSQKIRGFTTKNSKESISMSS